MTSPVFPGRIEAKANVPTGGAAVSVSTGALSSPVTATLPAGNYFLTAAGGVSSLTTALTTAINSVVTPYPQSAAAMQAALGYGAWTSGAFWACQETSGNLAATFGAPTLTATSLTYSNVGPGTGGDLAIGFSGATSNANGGDVFDVNVGDDLIIVWVAKVGTAPASNRDFISKRSVGTPGFILYENQANNGFTFTVLDGVISPSASTTSFAVGEWHVGMAVVDRAAVQARVGLLSLSSSTSSIPAAVSIAGLGTLANAVNFLVGNGSVTGNGPDTNTNIAAIYIVAGSGVAAGLSAGMSTALTNLKSAINSSFTASVATTTTGLATIANSQYPSSVTFTDTNLRDLLGFAYNFDYPQTAAQMTTALGYGNWATGAGYLCNEASGNLAPIFGSPTLTATALGYSNLGPRGGADKAISFTASNADGGANFDVGTGDLIVAYVGFIPATPAAFATFVSKVAAADASGWSIFTSNAGFYGIDVIDGGGEKAASTGAAGYCVGEWHVAIGVIDRSTGKIRFGTQGLRSGTQTVSAETAVSGSITTAATFRLGASAWLNSLSGFQLAAAYVVTGASVATGLSANIATALSSFASYMKSQTGTKQAKGLVMFDCPLDMPGDPYQAPIATDKRGTESPTGFQISYVSNSKYRAKGLVWSHVPKERVWESAVTYANASYETWLKDTQLGLGHSWFSPGSRVQVYWNNNGTQTLVGGAANSGTGLTGWFIKGIDSIEPTLSVQSYSGLWRIEWNELVSDG